MKGAVSARLGCLSLCANSFSASTKSILFILSGSAALRKIASQFVSLLQGCFSNLACIRTLKQKVCKTLFFLHCAEIVLGRVWATSIPETLPWCSPSVPPKSANDAYLESQRICLHLSFPPSLPCEPTREILFPRADQYLYRFVSAPGSMFTK